MLPDLSKHRSLKEVLVRFTARIIFSWFARPENEKIEVNCELGESQAPPLNARHLD